MGAGGYVSAGHVTGGAAASSTWANSLVDDVDYVANADRWKLSTVDTAGNNDCTSGTLKVLTWESETYDTFGLHAAGATSITIVTPGLYLVRARINWAASSAGFREIWIAKGPTGTTPGTSTARIVAADLRIAAAALNPTTNAIEDEVQCANGDVLWVVGLQSSGGPLGPNTGATDNAFSGRWVASS